jgi:hypothetical protein
MYDIERCMSGADWAVDRHYSVYDEMKMTQKSTAEKKTISVVCVGCRKRDG